MKGVRQLIMILFLLSVIAILTYGQAPVKLNGSEGMALLQSLTKATLQLNNTSLNATNSSANMTAGGDASSNLWSWGSRPKDPPLPQTQSGVDYLNDSV